MLELIHRDMSCPIAQAMARGCVQRWCALMIRLHQDERKPVSNTFFSATEVVAIATVDGYNLLDAGQFSRGQSCSALRFAEHETSSFLETQKEAQTEPTHDQVLSYLSDVSCMKEVPAIAAPGSRHPSAAGCLMLLISETNKNAARNSPAGCCG